MIDYKRNVDEIRYFLQSDQAGDGRVGQAVDQYIKACQMVNERLRQCENCLRQRLYAEAVHLAEAEPRLLELYAILEVLENLDYEDRVRWDKYLSQSAMGRPPALMRQVALELNQAYMHVKPMEELLRRHRLLAWSKAPLKERLPVLRELAKLNPNNHLWADDVRALEQERLKELEKDANTAIQQGDSATVQQLIAEMDSSPWLTPPSPDLRNRLQQTAFTIHRSTLIPKLESDLLQAWAAQDANRVRQLRDELSKVIGPPEGPDPTWRRLQAALHWLQADDAFNEGLAKLQDLLEHGAPEPELYRWYDYLLEFNRPMPDWLDQHFENRVLEMRSTTFERKVLFLVIGTVLFLIVGIAVVALIFYK
jgi:hypothetical protein